jgi:hypothetical protein
MTIMKSRFAPCNPELLNRVHEAIHSLYFAGRDRSTQQPSCHWTCLPQSQPSRPRQDRSCIFFRGKPRLMEIGALEITRFFSFLAVQGQGSAPIQNCASKPFLHSDDPRFPPEGGAAAVLSSAIRPLIPHTPAPPLPASNRPSLILLHHGVGLCHQRVTLISHALANLNGLQPSATLKEIDTSV